MPLLSSSRTTHDRCFGSGAAAKFRRLLVLGTSTERLPFSLFSRSATVKLKKICQPGSAARLKRK